MDRNARRRAIKALGHDEFELLVHEVLVAARGNEETTLRKLRPPDGGADSLVLSRGAQVEGIFQAKHSPDRAPDWAKWERSLDDAVAFWSPSWVTFVASINFTRDQQRDFARRLGERHPNVEIDALTLTDVERLLDKHPQVAPRFLGPDARDIRAAVERATKLGGAQLETATDLVARAGELADFADEIDPRFEYEQTLGQREPQWAEDPYVTLVEETSGRRYVRTDAFVREEADVSAPIIAFTDDEAGREARERARDELARGHDAVLTSGVRVLFPQAPRLVREMADDDCSMRRGILFSGDSVEIRVALETDEAALERTFTMHSVPPKVGGGLALAAVDGALWFELIFPDPPSADFLLNCSARFGSSAGDNLLAASWARALTGDAQVSLSCPELLPDGLDAPVQGRDEGARAELTARREVYADLVFIERSLGIQLTLPERFSRSELAVIQTARDILRTRRGKGTFDAGKMVVSPEEVRRYEGTLRGVRRRGRIVLELWGTWLDLGLGEWLLPPLVVVERRYLSDSEPDGVELELRPAGDTHMSFELVEPDTPDSKGGLRAA